MKNILITGGAGFIGSNFVDYIIKSANFDKIIILDKLTYCGSLENLRESKKDPRFVFIRGDICDKNLVKHIFHQYSVDTVVNFAAETHVDRSILAPETFIRTNILGTFNLLENARKYWEKISPSSSKVHFHHISTDEVFGSLQKNEAPFTEDSKYKPNSPYSASKASCDHFIHAYFQTYKLPVTISNCSNNYGPRQFPEKLIPLMVFNALEGKPIPVYGDGKQIRDWLYVEDHCDAILQIMKNGKPGETYNVGGDNQTPNIELIYSVCEILDELLPNSGYFPHKNLVTFVTDRPGHDRRYATDISKINRELNWKPKNNLSDGLRATIQWYLSNTEWVRKIKQKNSYQSWLKKNYIKR